MSSAVDQFPAALFQGRIALKLAVIDNCKYTNMDHLVIAFVSFEAVHCNFVCNILHLTPILYHVCNGYIGLLVQLMTLYQAYVFNIIVQLNELETSLSLSLTILACMGRSQVGVGMQGTLPEGGT